MSVKNLYNLAIKYSPSSLTIVTKAWLVAAFRVIRPGIASREMVNVSSLSTLLSGVIGMLKHAPSEGVFLSTVIVIESRIVKS